MKKIVPFKKKLTFDTNVSEITSISLENTLHCSLNVVDGELIINGSYKITDTSIKVDDFEFRVPVNIEIDDKYITDNIIIDIDDFYYEIINSNILEVNIDILLDNLVSKPMIDQVREEVLKSSEEDKVMEQEDLFESVVSDDVQLDNSRCIDEDDVYEEIGSTSVTSDFKDNNIFDSFSTGDEDYSTYYVYIVREGDTLDSIMTKYDISMEKMMEYNDVSELKLGDKLIIPEYNV